MAFQQLDPAKIKDYMRFLCQTMDEEFIVIGGWAVHAYDCKETTFDGDAIISYRAEGELRDSYFVTKNPRMKKSQFLSEVGCDIDLYVEHQHGLRISYEEAQAYHQKRDGMNVVCPEHLLILKIEAFKDRRVTPKGQKDKEDLIRLLLHAPFEHPELLTQHLDEADIELLQEVTDDRNTIRQIACANDKDAKHLRETLKAKLLALLSP
jgi:hypothetical protein